MPPSPAYELPFHVDSTMMSAFKSCHQKFYREYGWGLRPTDLSIDLHAGACFSAALERYYRELFLSGVPSDLALARAYATFTHDWGDVVPAKDGHPKTAANMWSAVESYLATYPARSDSVQPYFTSGVPSFEFSFAIPLDFPGFPRHPISGDPFIYVGRFDLFGKWRDSIPCVRDEKTAQRLESNWSDKWNLRAQFLGYCWALQHNGIPCNTVVVRGVIIRSKDIAQVEAVKQYPQHLIDKWFEQLKRDLNALVECHNSGWWDYNLGDSCTAYFRNCAFMDLCTSHQPEAWIDSFSTKRWNPLSRNPVGDLPSSIAPNFVERGNIPEKFRQMEAAGFFDEKGSA